MSAQKIGRNDPCPCGSGKKYKRCCSVAGRVGSMTNVDELREALAGQTFADLDDASDFVQSFVQQNNNVRRPDFHDLTSEQMSKMLNTPFESPQQLRFADTLTAPADAPIMLLFEQLTDAIGTDGLKATAKGNLPRAFCKAAAQAYGFGDANNNTRGRSTALRFGPVNKEDDFYDLHVTRLVAQLAGLIRKYKGRFLLTKRCRTILERDGHAGIYPRLLRAHATEFNWGYGDGHPELSFVQQAFAFTLYLLSRYGNTPRSQHFYEDAFLIAFPMLADEIPPPLYGTAREQVRNCYTLRTFERFANFFGLITLTPTTDDIWRKYEIVKTPLLDAVVQFDLDG